MSAISSHLQNEQNSTTDTPGKQEPPKSNKESDTEADSIEDGECISYDREVIFHNFLNQVRKIEKIEFEGLDEIRISIAKEP